MAEWKLKSDDVQSYECAKQVFKTGNTNEDVVSIYNNWAKNGQYMQDTDPERYKAHIFACEDVEKYFDGDLGNVKVIDIGAGTGRAGSELSKKGFKLMDALEPSELMLKEAKKLNLYQNYFPIGIGADRLPIDDNTYDLGVVSGAMGEGHIPCEALHEMARIVKPGGLVTISMREEFLDSCTQYHDKLEPLMRNMETRGEWKMLARNIKPDYYCGKNGLVFRFSPC